MFLQSSACVLLTYWSTQLAALLSTKTSGEDAYLAHMNCLILNR